MKCGLQDLQVRKKQIKSGRIVLLVIFQPTGASNDVIKRTKHCFLHSFGMNHCCNLIKVWSRFITTKNAIKTAQTSTTFNSFSCHKWLNPSTYKSSFRVDKCNVCLHIWWPRFVQVPAFIDDWIVNCWVRSTSIDLL